jgi:hypothetical protein
MAKATGLKMWFGGHLQWHHLPTKFQEYPQISSKLISGTDTHRHDYLISLLSFLECRLKRLVILDEKSDYQFLKKCSTL